MKKIFSLVAIAATMLMASCSDGVVTPEDIQTPEVNNPFGEDGTAYVKLDIKLPVGTTKGVGDNDNYGDFNDGDENEYTVENAILGIFTDNGTDETDETKYTFLGAYMLGSGNWNKNGSEQITSSREFIQKISNKDAKGGKLYAYVILNKHDFFEVNDETHELTFNSGKPGAEDIKLIGKTLEFFGSLDIQEYGRRYDTNSFMMTNMPYANKKGGNSQPSDAKMYTLYPINDCIYATLAEAQKSTSVAAEINVERVLAKVEVNWNEDTYTTELGNYTVEINGWFIDNTNPNTYVGRHFTEPEFALNYLTFSSARTQQEPLYQTQTYRFVSKDPVTAGAYRTFWAIDCNYNKTVGEGCDPLMTKQGLFVGKDYMQFDNNGHLASGALRKNGAHYYCTENTFDVEHMSAYNTTRVVIAATLNGGHDFYTIDQEANVMYTSVDALKDYAKALVANRNKFKDWVANYCNDEVDDATKFIDILVADPVGTEAGAVVTSMNTEPVGFTTDMVKTGVSYSDAKEAYKNMVEVAKEGHNAYLASNVKANYYKGGISYYSALIQHFGQNETPWRASDYAGNANSTAGVYGYAPATGEGFDSESYLGRYGIVRNNWYNIEVQGVRQIGSPVVPKLPGGDEDVPDDQIESYLKVRINITPWVIRKQSVIL